MDSNIKFAKPDIELDESASSERKSRFRLFFWGMPSPSGKTYTKEVAESIVDTINEQGMMAAFSPKLNIHLVGGLVSNAEILGNVVYADVALLGDTKELVEKKWEDGNYRCTVVLKAHETESNEIGVEDIAEISHVMMYS